METQHRPQFHEKPLAWAIAVALLGALALLMLVNGPAEIARADTGYSEKCLSERKQVCLRLGFSDGSDQQGNCVKELAGFEARHEKLVAARDHSVF